MKEKKEAIKISLKMALLLALVSMILVGIIVFCVTSKILQKDDEVEVTSGKEVVSSKNYSIEKYKRNEYYIIEDDYDGEYDLQYVEYSKYYEDEDFIDSLYDGFMKQDVLSYSEYKSYCKEWKFDRVYDDTSMNYIIISYFAYGQPILKARLAEVEYNNKTADIYVWDYSRGITADISAYMIVIPTDKKIKNVNVVPLMNRDEFNDMKSGRYQEPVEDKPIIYLYPEEEMELTVKLGNPEELTCSYPKYINDGWRVIADPDGSLKDVTAGRNLYSLYYESNCKIKFEVEKEGFVVKKNDIISFLEDKLNVLGLTDREAEEFIVYWLPKLQKNEYNYIRFASLEEINENMPLEFSDNPDSLIRILMIFKGLDEPIEVEEQVLMTPERTGFVAVEWGGTEILD